MNYKINIIYEDNHILAVEKPVNVPTQEDETKDKDMLTILKEDLKQRYNKPGNVFLGLVHRLDRPVGGVMTFAKTSKAASRLSEQIRTHEFKKTYIAVVHGVLDKSEETLINYLLKDTKTNIVSAVPKSTPEAKEAVLDYEVLEAVNNLSLLKINLHTGRPHQIRVQFSNIGHPLFGDQKYGSNLNKAGQQIALWSHKISFSHPTTKEKVEFSSSPPDSYPWNCFDFVYINQ